MRRAFLGGFVYKGKRTGQVVISTRRLARRSRQNKLCIGSADAVARRSRAGVGGRLWAAQGTDTRAAAECFRAIEWEAISLHPQIVIERDKALAALGPETLEERRRWLDAARLSDDEWLAERRASLFIDAGDSQAALNVLRNTRFQLVHQRYERTRLWRQAETNLGIEPVEYPAWLGEDDLAEFGAYREHPHRGNSRSAFSR